MKPIFIGFGPTEAHSVIFWHKDDDIVSKTVCYTEQDVFDMLDKYNTSGSLYNSFDGYSITRIKVEETA